MNERIDHPEDKMKTIEELLLEQGKTPTAYDLGNFLIFERILKQLKSDSEKWGNDHPEIKATVGIECTRIESELDKIADRHGLFEEK